MIAFLLANRKDIAYLFVILSLVGGFLWYRHALIVEGQDDILAADSKAVATQQAAVDAQEAKDLKVLKEAQDAYRVELQADAAANAADPLPSVRLCDSSSSGPVPAPAKLSSNPSPASGLLQPSPSLHSQGPDVSGSLQLLVNQADQLAADARELAAVAH